MCPSALAVATASVPWPQHPELVSVPGVPKTLAQVVTKTFTSGPVCTFPCSSMGTNKPFMYYHIKKKTDDKLGIYIFLIIQVHCVTQSFFKVYMYFVLSLLLAGSSASADVVSGTDAGDGSGDVLEIVGK